MLQLSRGSHYCSSGVNDGRKTESKHCSVCHPTSTHTIVHFKEKVSSSCSICRMSTYPKVVQNLTSVSHQVIFLLCNIPKRYKILNQKTDALGRSLTAASSRCRSCSDQCPKIRIRTIGGIMGISGDVPPVPTDIPM